MTELFALRLYFPLSTKAHGTRFWHKLTAPNLSHHLLAYARRVGIRQAVLIHIDAGYLPGGRLTHHGAEGSNVRHPQCIELVDTESKLRKFIEDHALEVKKTHAVLFKCEVISPNRHEISSI